MVQTITDQFNPQTGIFKCAPCNVSEVAPVFEGAAQPKPKTDWRRAEIRDTPYQLPPLRDSARTPPPGANMSDIDERIQGEALRGNARQDRESPILLVGAFALCAVCLYCKMTQPIPRPAGEQELSPAQYQEQMRRAKAENPREEPRPAVRIPELKNKTRREGQRP